MDGLYLIPANSKRSMLIFGIFNKFDLILFCSGVGTSLFLVTLVSLTNTWITVLALLPGLISGFLVMPIPYHHNILTGLKAMYEFFTTRQKFVWRGWCYSNGESNEKQIH